MICRRLTAKAFLFGLALGTILFAVIVAGCTRDAENRDGRDSDGATTSQGISERESGDSGDERGARREDSEEHGTGGDDGGGESREAAMSSPIIPQAVQQANLQGMSIRRMARELGIHRETVRRYIDAESPPTRRTPATPPAPASDTIAD